MVCEFYDKFYRLRLTNAQLNDMLAAGRHPAPRNRRRPVGASFRSDSRPQRRISRCREIGAAAGRASPVR